MSGERIHPLSEQETIAIVGEQWALSLTTGELTEFFRHMNAVSIPDSEIAPAFRGFVRGCEFYRGISRSNGKDRMNDQPPKDGIRSMHEYIAHELGLPMDDIVLSIRGSGNVEAVITYDGIKKLIERMEKQ